MRLFCTVVLRRTPQPPGSIKGAVRYKMVVRVIKTLGKYPSARFWCTPAISDKAVGFASSAPTNVEGEKQDPPPEYFHHLLFKLLSETPYVQAFPQSTRLQESGAPSFRFDSLFQFPLPTVRTAFPKNDSSTELGSPSGTFNSSSPTPSPLQSSTVSPKGKVPGGYISAKKR